MADLQAAFNAFAHVGAGKGPASNEIDGPQFAKLCKESKLLDKALAEADVDAIFGKIKDKSGSKINFKQFEAGLALIAEKKKCPVKDLTAKIVAAKPASNPTKAEASKAHDDKSLAPGVCKSGGAAKADCGKDAKSGSTAKADCGKDAKSGSTAKADCGKDAKSGSTAKADCGKDAKSGSTAKADCGKDAKSGSTAKADCGKDAKHCGAKH